MINLKQYKEWTIYSFYFGSVGLLGIILSLFIKSGTLYLLGAFALLISIIIKLYINMN